MKAKMVRVCSPSANVMPGFRSNNFYRVHWNFNSGARQKAVQHPVIESGKGVYPIDKPREWLVQIAPYANFALKVLTTVAPMAAPAINTFFGSKTTETWKLTTNWIWRKPSWQTARQNQNI